MNNPASAGEDMTVPQPNGELLLSVKYWRLVVRRLNALIKMQSKGATANGPLQITDSNCILPVAGSGGGTITVGSGQIIKLNITNPGGIHDNWLDCVDLALTHYKVAKPTLLRNTVTTRGVHGNTINYTSYSPDGMSRTATSPYGAGLEVLEPEYMLGDVIYAQNVGATGVTVSGVPVTYIDINCDGRRFGLMYGE